MLMEKPHNKLMLSPFYLSKEPDRSKTEDADDAEAHKLSRFNREMDILDISRICSNVLVPPRSTEQESLRMIANVTAKGWGLKFDGVYHEVDRSVNMISRSPHMKQVFVVLPNSKSLALHLGVDIRIEDLVLEVKEKYVMTGKFYITYGGKVLKHEVRMNEYDIQDNATLHMGGCILGGSQSLSGKLCDGLCFLYSKVIDSDSYIWILYCGVNVVGFFVFPFSGFAVWIFLNVIVFSTVFLSRRIDYRIHRERRNAGDPVTFFEGGWKPEISEVRRKRNGLWSRRNEHREVYELKVKPRINTNKSSMRSTSRISFPEDSPDEIGAQNGKDISSDLLNKSDCKSFGYDKKAVEEMPEKFADILYAVFWACQMRSNTHENRANEAKDMNGKRIQIFVHNVDSKLIHMSVPINGKVRSIKSKLMRKTNLDLTSAYFIYGAKILHETKTFYEYGVQNHSTIWVMMPIKGGSKTEAKTGSAKKGGTGAMPNNSTNMKIWMKENDKEISNVNSIICEEYEENVELLEKAKGLIDLGQTYKLFSDGACKTNPGCAGAGYVIYDEVGNEIYENSVPIEHATNNMAEYAGLIYGLKTCLKLGIRRLELFCDAEVVVKQLRGEYKVKNEGLMPLYEIANSHIQSLERVLVHWISRDDNEVADRLAKSAIRGGNAAIGVIKDPKTIGMPNLKEGTKMLEEDNKAQKKTDTKKISQTSLKDFCTKNSSKVKEEVVIKEEKGNMELDKKTPTKVGADIRPKLGNNMGPNLLGQTDRTWSEQCQKFQFGQSPEETRHVNESGVNMGLFFNLCAQLAKAQESGANPFKSTLKEDNKIGPQETGAVQYTDQLGDHTRKIWILHDVSAQIIDKTRELDSTLSGLIDYGATTLEPWRKNITTMVESIPRSLNDLWNATETTNYGCSVLEDRINQLSEEIVALRRENERLAGEVEELKRTSLHSSAREKMEEELDMGSLSDKLQENVVKLRDEFKRSIEDVTKELKSVERMVKKWNLQESAQDKVATIAKSVDMDVGGFPKTLLSMEVDNSQVQHFPSSKSKMKYQTKSKTGNDKTHGGGGTRSP